MCVDAELGRLLVEVNVHTYDHQKDFRHRELMGAVIALERGRWTAGLS